MPKLPAAVLGAPYNAGMDAGAGAGAAAGPSVAMKRNELLLLNTHYPLVLRVCLPGSGEPSTRLPARHPGSVQRVPRHGGHESNLVRDDNCGHACA